MPVQATSTSPLFSTPYITAQEYLQAPTGEDATNLVKGDQAASMVELGNLIARASSLADLRCNQVLAATSDTESVRAAVSRDGYLHLHPRYWPILELVSLSYGTDPANIAALTDLSGVWVEPQELTVPLGSLKFSSAGPLQFGTPAYSGSQLFVRYTYQNGYPTTLLASALNAPGTQITVADATGVIGGLTSLIIYDGAQTETVHVASVAGNVLTLSAATTFAHPTVGVSVSALPPAVKEAVILLTTSLIKTKGTGAIIAPGMRSQNPAGKTALPGRVADDLQLAWDLLDPFGRVR